MNEHIPLLNRSTAESSIADLTENEQTGNAASDKPPSSIFQVAQEGNLQLLTQYIASGSHKPNDIDSDGCSALHWAAINNHLACAKYLIELGATIDIIGGNLAATPLHWTIRSGHLGMATYLIHKGANYNLYDNQGYNSLHIAVHSGNPMLVLYLIALGMDIDSPDLLRRTPLMWASYLGTSMEMIDSIISFKPDINFQDNSGFTALHWAISANKFEIAQKLVRAGASLELTDINGKTAEAWSCERGQLKEFQNCIIPAENSFNTRYNDKQTQILIFSLGFFSIPFSTFVATLFDWYYGIPLACLYLIMVSQYIVGKVLLSGNMHYMVKTSFLFSVTTSSLVYALFTWIKILPCKIDNHGSNKEDVGVHMSGLYISLLFGITGYSLYKSFALDAGVIEPNATDSTKKECILHLASVGELDARRYCHTCSIRKPLRSKHCIYCNKCVAKFDHHCPWTFNCGFILYNYKLIIPQVGHNNHRYFMVFILALVFGIPVFVSVIFSYLSTNSPPLSSELLKKCSFSPAFCSYMHFDPGALSIALQMSFHTMWIAALLCMQIYQVSVARTTNEAVNSHRLEYLIHPEDTGLPWHHRKYWNPFDFGLLRNCTDFWTGVPSNHLDWYTQYRGMLIGFLFYVDLKVPVELMRKVPNDNAV